MTNNQTGGESTAAEIAKRLKLRLPCEGWVERGMFNGLKLWRSEVEEIISTLLAANQPVQATPAKDHTMLQLASILAGLECAPTAATFSPEALYLIGQEIARQAKDKATQAPTANAPAVLNADEHTELETYRRVLAGLPDGAIDGGWTAAGICSYAKKLEENLIEKTRQFKNFHEILCERFNYYHDDTNWMRDRLSLAEHIAKKISVPALLNVDEDTLAQEIAGLKAVNKTLGQALGRLIFVARMVGGVARLDKELKGAIKWAERAMSIGGISHTYCDGVNPKPSASSCNYIGACGCKTPCDQVAQPSAESIRDRALEEAALVCEAQMDDGECAERAQYCADAIRALQSSPEVKP